MKWFCLTLAVWLTFLVLVVPELRAADTNPPTVVLHRLGAKELSAETQAKLATWAVAFLNTASFNTSQQPNILAQSVAQIQEHYRATAGGDYLVVTYDHPVTLPAGGDRHVTLVEIVIGLNRPDQYPSALFTIDPEGRVVAHEKYDGSLPDELRKTATTQPAR